MSSHRCCFGHTFTVRAAARRNHPLDETELVTAESDEPTLLPVVGIGASAGGLAATTTLLRELGATPKLAVVVVHHLEPTRESELAALLARTTAMPVSVAENGAKVALNHVYVVPENACIAIREGRAPPHAARRCAAAEPAD